MIQIRPVSDLRNKFPDVEKAVACRKVNFKIPVF